MTVWGKGAWAGVLASGLTLVACSGFGGLRQSDTSFKKIVLDRRFVAESVAVADVNRDGKLDIVAGNIWYEAPKWVPHEIAPFVAVNPATGYSNCFNSWMVDLNRDGWPDQIVIGMPGEPAVWRENPRGGNGPWKTHPIWHSACNESPLFVDLFKTGHKVLVMGTDDDALCWFEPAKDPNAEWICHRISGPKGAGSQRYSHGLGVGDIDGDGRNEVLTSEGYYRQNPHDKTAQWSFVKTDLGPPCAQMEVIHVGKGLPSVVSSSAHERGIWWHEQISKDRFEHHLLDDRISQTHSLVVTRLGTDHRLNLVTGKRFWAHGPNRDPGANEAAVLLRFELSWDHGKPVWTRYILDEDSGVGTQFVISDLLQNRKPVIVVANKKGVILFETVRH